MENQKIIYIFIGLGMVFILLFLFMSKDTQEVVGVHEDLPSVEQNNVDMEDSTEREDSGNTAVVDIEVGDDREVIVTKDVTEEKTILSQSSREIFEVDGVLHSIPPEEIYKGIPALDPKDRIPSIDEPKYLLVNDVDYLEDDEIGLGLSYKGVERFYPYKILVRHELVNDFVAGDALLVSYCPLCGTGIIFDRTVAGEVEEFGVSGFLWQSNVLMYNRSAKSSDESLWSQVLGESVRGTHTGEKMTIIRSDTVTYGKWRVAHPNTQVLSEDTGIYNSYERDPYGSYYTDSGIMFPTSNTDDRLHTKEYVLGIEINGVYKAYVADSIVLGETKDIVNGEEIIVNRSTGDEIVFTFNGQIVDTVGAFWFSWVAVHPETELFE